MPRKPAAKKAATKDQNPTLDVRSIKIADMNMATYNPRKKLRKSDRTYKEIAGSLDKFNLVETLVFNLTTNTLVGGHQRITVGQAERGWTAVPCSCLELPLEDEKALNVILNAVGEGNWDEEKLQPLLADIKARGSVDIYSLGFDPQRIQAILGNKPKKTKRDPDDEAPATPTKAITKAGDLYTFITGDGETQHQLLCGDSTNIDDHDRLMDSAKASLIFTDPPYGVSYQSKAKGGKIKNKGVRNDDLRDTVLQEFLQKAFSAMSRHTTSDPTAYVFYASKCHMAFKLALDDSGWEEKQQLLWHKQMVLGRSDYHWCHEPLFYAKRAGAKSNWYGSRAEKTFFNRTAEDIDGLDKREAIELLHALHENTDVWDIARDPPSTYVHPTQKPTALARRAMRNSTMIGDTTLEPFAGSGSTMIAGELEGRHTRNIELDPGLCDVIATRFVDTFEEVVITRNGKEINPSTLK
tara:strand:- start:28210 stop:29610 length:1401 start_codon:yes stop_codon:yes gene_type:complete